MTVLTILEFPDPRLNLVAEPVKEVDDAVRQLVDDMIETMYADDAIGLAAIQVNVQKAVLVYDFDWPETGKREPNVVINPVVTWESPRKVTEEEGCMSFPGVYPKVTRPEAVHVTFLDRDGIEQKVEADGFLARCLQHEMDHLKGITFLDHLSALKRQMVIRKLNKNRRVKG